MDSKIAQILVECGYALRFTYIPKKDQYWITIPASMGEEVIVDPFADTLEGRRQLDALENYFRGTNTHTRLIWQKAIGAGTFKYADNHQWRIEITKRSLGYA